MKKIISILFFISLFLLVSSSFAAQDVMSTDDSNDTAQFTITDGGTDKQDLTFGLSPKVVAKYVNPGTSDATGQWYSVGTVHPGGTKAFGTTQDLNNMYIKAYKTGTEITDTILDIPATKTSADAWNDNWKI